MLVPKRINEALSSKVEKRILQWLAERMPSWVWPDTMTSLAFLAACGISFCFIIGPFMRAAYLIAAILFVVHWFGDAMDGTIARYRKMARPRYGHYVDHLVDSASISLMLGGLTLSALTFTASWMWVLAGFLLLMVHAQLVASVTKEFHLSVGLLGPTEARTLGFLLSIGLFFTGNPLLISGLTFWVIKIDVTLLDILGIVTAFIVWILLLWRSILTAWRLDREDRKLWKK